MSRDLTIGSLFSGIGGLELGLERAGVGHTIWQVEQSAYCRAVLAKHWPDAVRFDDVRTVGAHNLPRVDVLCGGFPCQDISYAGKGAGLAGERSGLWYEFARIIRELGPRYAVLENVAALLNRGFSDVLGTLADCGYDAEWSCIRAFDVGATHLRDRVFVVAYPNAHRARLQGRFGSSVQERPDERLAGALGACMADADRERELQPEGRITDERRRTGDRGPHVGHTDGLGRRHGTQWQDRPEARDAGWWRAEPDVGGSLDGFPAWLDGHREVESHKLYLAYGNASEERPEEIVRAVRRAADALGHWRTPGGHGRVSPEAVLFAYVRQLAGVGEEGDAPLARTATAEISLRVMRDTAQPSGAPRRPRSEQQRSVERADPMQALSRLLARHAEEAWVAYRRENAAAVLNAWGDGWEDGIARTAHGVPRRVDRLRALGNAVVPQVAEVVGRVILALEAQRSEAA